MKIETLTFRYQNIMDVAFKVIEMNHEGYNLINFHQKMSDKDDWIILFAKPTTN